MDSEVFTAMEHRDLQANTMAINNTGNFILLAGRRYIAIRNLDDLDNDNIRKFPMHSKYDVGSAEWNPTDHNSQLCVISSNQRLEVFTWSLGELTLLNSLKAHTRVITDLNWSRTDPNLLSSCSVDTFIHIWDLRDPRRPASSLSAIAEASQVRWNPLNPHVLATAHDGDAKLWDMRRGSAPTQYIAAHLAKIHGLDWNPTNERQLATCSQDNTVKFFDVENARRAESVLTTNAPVWRARFTPFGNGLVTVVVPQLRRGENSLLLWNTMPGYSSAPVHTFAGHKDVVLEFAWRQQRHISSNGRRSNNNRHRKRCKTSDYELITWSKDQTLLIWRADARVLQLCDYNNVIDEKCDFSDDDDSSDDLADLNDLEMDRCDKTTGYIDIPNNGRIVKSTNDDADAADRNRTVNVTLQQEFSLLNVNIGQLQVLQMDISQRLCVVRVVSTRYLVTLQVTFPVAYPLGVPPTFTLIPGESSIDDSASRHLTETLAHVAQMRVLKNRACLEPCLRQMVTTLDQLSSNAPPSVPSPDHASLLASNTNSYNLSFLLREHSQQQHGGGYGASNDVDMFVPWPRMSGARWGGAVGGLVCFGFGQCARIVGVVGQQLGGGKRGSGGGGGSYGEISRQFEGREGMPRSLAEWKELRNRRSDGGWVGANRRERTRSSTYSTSADKHHNLNTTNHRTKSTTSITKRQQQQHTNQAAPPIHIYDLSDLFLANRPLAALYQLLDGDVSAVCRWNAGVARREERFDLVQAWRLVELVVSSTATDGGGGWHGWGRGGCVEEAAEVAEEEDALWSGGRHPFGAALIHSLISHYAAQNDIQTAAMLSCIFSKQHDLIPRKNPIKESIGSTSHRAIPPADIVAEGWVIPLLNRATRSSSLDNLRAAEESAKTATPALAIPSSSAHAHQTGLYEYYKRSYADTLLRWNLLYNRAEVLKYSTHSMSPPHVGLQFLADCQHCVMTNSFTTQHTSAAITNSPGAACVHCRRPSLRCVICHISVRGSANCCLSCGHGGHTGHLDAWFRRNDVCATGCGCRCLTMSNQ